MTIRATLVAVATGLTVVAVGSGGETVIPAGNLAQNPGAELGQGTTDVNVALPLRGWEIEVTPEVTNPGVPPSGFTPARYGGHDYFPTPAVSAAIGGGRNFLYAGPYRGQHVAHVSRAFQTLDVVRAAAEIDAGGVNACLSAYLGGQRNWANYRIWAELELLAEDGSRLGQMRIGPVTAAQRKNLTTLLRRGGSRPVPRGTRQLRVVLVADATVGGATYGYADNVLVGLTKGACEPVLAVRCVRGALVATVTPSGVMRTQRVRFAVKGGKRTKQAQDARAPYSARFPMAGFTGRLQVTATVTAAGSGPIVLTKRSRRC